VGLAGGLGAIGRFVLDGSVSQRLPGFPWGTLAVNLSGAFALGVLAGAHVHGDALLLAGTAVLGSYTTFSTWILESQRLGESDRVRALALNLAGSLALGLLLAEAGRLVGGAL
jgi:CrcB protein